MADRADTAARVGPGPFVALMQSLGATPDPGLVALCPADHGAAAGRVVTVRRRAAVAQFRMLAGGIAYARFSGPLSGPCLAEFGRQQLEHAGPAARGILSDYRGAVFTVTADDWLRAIWPLGDAYSGSVARACVGVAGEPVQLLRAHARLMARQLLLTRVFLSVERAQEWLATMADSADEG